MLENKALEALSLEDIKARYLPKRDLEAHKGDFGHVLIIGGDKSYSGSVLMAGIAALRVGSGLVSIATHPEHAVGLNLNQPELMVSSIHQVEHIDELLKKASVVLLGPGMTDSWWSLEVARYVVSSDLVKDIPMVIDAGALPVIKKLKLYKDNWVLTPHPKEAADLLGSNLSHVQNKRLEKAARICQQYGGVAVLKGYRSIITRNSDDILDKSDKSDKSGAVICEAGNPGMAVGGMGDVLAGMVAGFIAQKVPIFYAAVLAVFMHAQSADKAVDKYGQRGLLPTDLFNYFSDI